MHHEVGCDKKKRKKSKEVEEKEAEEKKGVPRHDLFYTSRPVDGSIVRQGKPGVQFDSMVPRASCFQSLLNESTRSYFG